MLVMSAPLAATMFLIVFTCCHSNKHPTSASLPLELQTLILFTLHFSHSALHLNVSLLSPLSVDHVSSTTSTFSSLLLSLPLLLRPPFYKHNPELPRSTKSPFEAPDHQEPKKLHNPPPFSFHHFVSCSAFVLFILFTILSCSCRSHLGSSGGTCLCSLLQHLYLSLLSTRIFISFLQRSLQQLLSNMRSVVFPKDP